MTVRVDLISRASLAKHNLALGVWWRSWLDGRYLVIHRSAALGALKSGASYGFRTVRAGQRLETGFRYLILARAGN